MKSINQLHINIFFLLITFLPLTTLSAQQDCNIDDPLTNVEAYDLSYLEDSCACQVIVDSTVNVFYKIEEELLPTCDCDSLNPYNLTSFSYPGGIWTGSEEFCGYDELADLLNSIQSVDSFYVDSLGVYAEKVDSVGGYGDLCFCNDTGCQPFTSDVSSFLSNSQPCNQCVSPVCEIWHITEPCDSIPDPVIDPDSLGANAPTPGDSLIMDIPNGDPFTTNDILENANFPDTSGAPSANAIGQLMNTIVSTGALQNGMGCTNINCLDLSPLADSLNTGELADSINANISESLPSGSGASSWSEHLSNELAAQINNVNLTQLLNENFGLNIPNTPCEGDLINLIDDPFTGGSQSSYRSLRNQGRNGSRMMSSPTPSTEADQNYFSQQIPGLGLDGPGAAAPSPSAMSMIEQIKGGVNLYNGSQNTSIPLYSVQANDISVPISLSSSNNGLKVNDLGSIVGQNWNLNTGGSISRVVKGLPDEFDGTLNGVGFGKRYELTPFFEFPSYIGVDVKILGKDNIGCISSPDTAVIKQKLKLGFTNTVYESDSTDCPVVKIDLSWTALRGNKISCLLSVKVYEFTLPPNNRVVSLRKSVSYQ